MASFGSLKSTIFEKEERKQQYQSHIRGLNAYDRHKKFMDDYVKFYGKERPSNLKLPIKTDQDTLREGYRFIRSEEDDMNPSWEQRLVKRYYDKLFKENDIYGMESNYLPANLSCIISIYICTLILSRYCLADMSQYKSGKIGLRWRTEKEVISGKGQLICGNKHCNEKDGLASYEVNFCYFEAGENKQALVKLVTCERCAFKLNYKRQKEKELLEKRQEEQDRRKRNRSKSDDDLDDFQESKERRRKGKKALTSASDHKIDDDDDNLDEFLDGMFL
ncbi:Protein FRA10AC1 [Glycine max]|nr:Protein FRA10AC1 [Glycine max]